MPNNSIMENLHKSGTFLRETFRLQGGTFKRFKSTVPETNNYSIPELTTAKPFEDIPKLTMFPFLGSSWLYFPIIGKHDIRRQHEAARLKHQEFGDIFREKFGHMNVVSVCVPDAMEIMFRNEGMYPHRREMTALRIYRESRKELYKSSGLFVQHDKDWRDLRFKTQKHLMKPKAIQAYLDPIQDIARDLVRRIYEERDPNTKEVNLFLDLLYKWALEAVAFVGLDTRLGCLDPYLDPVSDGRKLIESVKMQQRCMDKLEAFNGNFQFWRYIPSLTWRKYTKSSDIFTEIVFRYINRSLDILKECTDDDHDLTMLQAMLKTKDLDVSEAMAVVADMLFAGIETTAHTSGFLLYLLSKYPDKQEKLSQEISQCLPRTEDIVTPDIANNLRYLKACLKESLRLFPIVRGIARTLDHEVVICGYRIPAGTTIFCDLQHIQRNQKYFKQPSEFIPERWQEREGTPNHFAYAPFGIGIRSCIGRRLAELEILCLLTEIIRKFHIQYHHDDIDMYTGVVNKPDKPLRFCFLDRL